jgi:hypothetical protein
MPIPGQKRLQGSRKPRPPRAPAGPCTHTGSSEPWSASCPRCRGSIGDGDLESGSWIWISSEGKSRGPTKSADDSSHVAAGLMQQAPGLEKVILHPEIPRSFSFLYCLSLWENPIGIPAAPVASLISLPLPLLISCILAAESLDPQHCPDHSSFEPYAHQWTGSAVPR